VLSIVFLSTILIRITAVLYHRLTEALLRARTSLVHMENPHPTPVIVVGAGLAGLSVAYAALQAAPPSMRLLERAAKTGGNSTKASSGINGAPTRFQDVAKYGVDQSFWDDTVRSADSCLHASVTEPIRTPRQAFIATLTNRSAFTIGFLVDLSVDLSVVAQLGGGAVAEKQGAGAE
jgi:hypothetical protein